MPRDGASTPGLGLGLDLDASASSLRTSMSTDLGASYNLTNEGVRLLSASQREFHLHAAGHETRTAAERKAAAKIGSVAPNARAGPGSLGDDRNGARVSSDRRPGSDTPPRRSADDRRDVSAVSVAKNRDFSFVSGATGDMTVDVLPFDVIGSGAGGSVKRAIHVPSHTFIALKVMTVFDREKRKQLVNELRALADADARDDEKKNDDARDRVVGFLGAYYDAKHETVCVALEFADGGSLETALSRAGRPMPPIVVGDVCAQVAAGLEYLHEKKRLVHRDIKPGNVLVRRSGACKITDFGIVARSKMMEETDDGRDSSQKNHSQSVCLRSFKGSLRYMSPERVERKPYGRAADVWSLGVTLCECALGRYPFDEQDGGVLGLALKISQASETGEGILDRALARGIPKNDDDDVRDAWDALSSVLRECVRREPGDRPTATMLRRVPFVRSCSEISKRHLNDPRVNLGAFVRGADDGSAARDAEARAFFQHYIRLRDAARRAKAFCDAAAFSRASPETRKSGAEALERALLLLAGLYRKPSCLTLASGRRARGGENIARAIAESNAFDSDSSLVAMRETTTSVAALPGGVEGGALIVRSGFAHDESSGRRFVATDTFLVLRVHEGWDGANGGGRFYVRNQVEKRIESDEKS